MSSDDEDTEDDARSVFSCSQHVNGFSNGVVDIMPVMLSAAAASDDGEVMKAEDDHFDSKDHINNGDAVNGDGKGTTINYMLYYITIYSIHTILLYYYYLRKYFPLF
jgi:hypothetical protein